MVNRKRFPKDLCIFDAAHYYVFFRNFKKNDLFYQMLRSPAINSKFFSYLYYLFRKSACFIVCVLGT